ncbi:hypothetical protein [Bdellovibrio sp. HCB209]|uniref:hypothetical protein n=1 Tax=Bdellovibrio sp. HCB209 TaxID=3394354 RepID=UPI0039B5CC4F
MFKNLKILSSVVTSLVMAFSSPVVAQTARKDVYQQSETNVAIPVSSSGSGNFQPAAKTGNIRSTANSAASSAPIGNTDPALANNGPDGKDAGGESLEQVYTNILNNYSELQSYKNIKDSTAPKITEYKNKYQENRENCITRQNAAAWACIEKLSPAIQDGVAGLNILISTVGSAAVNDSCSTFAKAMDIAKYAFTAYTAACGAAKAGCGLSCVAARSALENLNKTLYSQPVVECVPQPTDAASAAACEKMRLDYYAVRKKMTENVKLELVESDKKSMAGKAEVCTGKYVQLLASGAAGIYGIAQSLKQGKSCEEESSADGSTTGTTTAETCAIEANANLPECICLKNPMLEGCGSTAARASMSASGSGLSALSATGSTTDAGGLTAADLASGSSTAETSSTSRDPSSASGVGAPVGGGGGANLGGSSGFGGGSAAGEGKDGHKALDTNILGGAGGGGGGGGMWGSGDSGSDKSGLRGYLPGGAKDPNKLSGQQQNWTKEVTGQGGKSNWEKVRDRYQDNKRTLINN